MEFALFISQLIFRFYSSTRSFSVRRTGTLAFIFVLYEKYANLSSFVRIAICQL